MIKIQNNTATRDPLPAFLIGLEPESLADLSWTDPALGVSDCKWLPEVDQSPALQQYERYGEETLTISGGVVIVTNSVVPFTAEEIAQVQAQEAAVKESRKQEIQAQIAALQTELTALE